MAWVALSLIFPGVSLSSISHREQISTPVTLAVTMTMSFRISSRYRSEVMAWLISIKALMYLSKISGGVFSIRVTWSIGVLEYWRVALCARPDGVYHYSITPFFLISCFFATPWRRFLQCDSPD